MEQLDLYWNNLTLAEKQHLVTLHRREKKTVCFFLALPTDIINLIAIQYLGNDVKAYCNLRHTCKHLFSLLPDYGRIVKNDNFDAYLYRFIHRLNKGISPDNVVKIANPMPLNPRRRYVDIVQNLSDTFSVELCRIDRETGLILPPSTDNPRGYIYHDHVESFFVKKSRRNDRYHLVSVRFVPQSSRESLASVFREASRKRLRDDNKNF